MKKPNEIEKLQRDWQQLDELSENKSITAFEIKQQLAVYQEKQKKEFIKEIMTFLLAAICILSFFIISFFQAPVLFIAIEVGACLLGPIILYFLFKRKKQQGKTIL